MALVFAGCTTHSPSQYVSPRVTGRVVDLQTHEPIPNVAVRRLASDETYQPLARPKGSEVLEQGPAIRTGEDGRFVLDSRRNLTLFWRLAWYSVSLSFEHPGYERFVTSYTPVNATNTVKGEPLVDAGDILLIRLAK